ncbi:2-phospho-L-lactate guanylyltransferase [Rhodoligotrophos defluvii]|uniref:2-phospho-L-lactate guanylyltransferase n=1 Tax=Rhodoligotrophos defluvii TaxID=2561934 RepID=UPI0010CA07FB|nr:2-phospho-L-lactate guanylyltransferase [Rhodoligotrophos defluvii]
MTAPRGISEGRSGNAIWAVLPIKTLSAAKQRLSGQYAAAFRRRLALTMAEDVLSALTAVTSLAGVMVVTCDTEAAALARHHGVRILQPEADAGHTDAVMMAARVLADEGAEGMLTMPADIPLVTPDEIAQLIATRRPAPSFTIVPAHDRNGSNAILSTPPEVVPLAFGDNSFAEHCRRVRALGLEPRIVISPGFGLDIDHPADLERLMARRGNTATHRLLRAEAAAGQLPEATRQAAL